MDEGKKGGERAEGEGKTDYLPRVNEQTMPKTLDPVITMAVVQRYIETERVKSRRTLLWLSSTFIFISVIILLLFISIGIFVLKNSRKSSQLVGEMTAQTALYASEMVDISNKVASLEGSNTSLKDTIEDRHARENEDKKLIKSDLVRFSEWVSSLNSREASVLDALQRRLSEFESRFVEKEKELTDIREKYAAFLNSLPDSLATADLKSNALDSSGANSSLAITKAENGHNWAIEQGILFSITSGIPLMTEVYTNLGPQANGQGEIRVIVLPNGDRYEGQFKDGFFNGWGVYYYKSGDRYEGEFRNDIKYGKGTFFYNNGDRYIGEFRDDMKNGRGTMLFRNGDRYTGDFGNDMINGKGTMIYQGGNKYAGDFKSGLRHGNGIIYFDNGDVYQGEFSDDLRTGKGTYIFADGAKYIGDFKDGKRDGKGRYIYATGEEYIGQFKDGKKDGEGLCIYPDGNRLKGLWKNDKLARILE